MHELAARNRRQEIAVRPKPTWLPIADGRAGAGDLTSSKAVRRSIASADKLGRAPEGSPGPSNDWGAWGKMAVAQGILSLSRCIAWSGIMVMIWP